MHSHIQLLHGPHLLTPIVNNRVLRTAQIGARESPNSKPIHYKSMKMKLNSPNLPEIPGTQSKAFSRSTVKIRTMGSEYQVEEKQKYRKPRFMCLHGFRTSGEIMKTQIGKWPESVRDKLDLVFLDAPFPANGKSDVEGIFDPPYYEWFQFNKEFTTYTNFDECLEYIEECIIKHGPIDGLLGFSQGAILSAALPGLQAQGIALTKVPKIKFLIIIGGAKLRNEEVAEKAYASPIQCPSLHFLGKEDFLKPYGEELLESVVDPVVIHHPKGHTVPRIADDALPTMFSFLDKIQKIVSEEETKSI